MIILTGNVSDCIFNGQEIEFVGDLFLTHISFSHCNIKDKTTSFIWSPVSSPRQILNRLYNCVVDTPDIDEFRRSIYGVKIETTNFG